jgi:hypothetical protein
MPFRNAARTMAMLLLGSSISCDDRTVEGSPLEGEWLIEMHAPGREASSPTGRSVRGVLVLDSDLPRYPDEQWRTGDSTFLVGRAYIDLVPLLRSTSEPVSQNHPPFASWQGSDRAETVFAKIGREDTVEIDLAPLINDFDPLLRGVIRGDTVRGQWTVVAHSVPPEDGSFIMWRTLRTAASDSALVRGRRGVRDWDRP